MCRVARGHINLMSPPRVTGHILLVFRVDCIHFPLGRTLREQGTDEEF